MRFKIIDKKIPYTGKELRSGWVLQHTGMAGDAAAAFLGPCHVKTEDLVDLDDVMAGTFIKSEQMAHVIAEHPGCDLGTGVLRQRMLVCILCELLGARGLRVQRRGDDVFIEDRKLTVSIAAPSPHSVLIHLGINIRPEGAPVPAVGLEEIGIEPTELLADLLGCYTRELESAAHAAAKVRPVE
ncbi:MAG: DUF366 family protein [Candidatus Latescibacterota bacterium]|nr:MAG: DUF366 family protein [Candidatus Latescibacterota bacterium]